MWSIILCQTTPDHAKKSPVPAQYLGSTWTSKLLNASEQRVFETGKQIKHQGKQTNHYAVRGTAHLIIRGKFYRYSSGQHTLTHTLSQTCSHTQTVSHWGKQRRPRNKFPRFFLNFFLRLVVLNLALSWIDISTSVCLCVSLCFDDPGSRSGRFGVELTKLRTDGLDARNKRRLHPAVRLLPRTVRQ